jgi:DNA-binding beta-propeller fold protein YncE
MSFVPMSASYRGSRRTGCAAICALILALFLAGCQDSASKAAPAATDVAQQASNNTETPPADAPAPPEPANNTRPAAPPPEEDMPEHPFPGAAKAPSLEGGVGWINTAGPLDIKDLRGKFVLLDFWTYCCINCLHILPELKKLEEAYPNEIVVIGVHSAKFETEEESESITEAVLRYEIEHPVVNDANHEIWNRYRVNSWPSVRVIDPEGNLVAGDSGEVEFEVLDGFFKKVLPYYKKKGLLDETPLRFDLEAYSAEKTPLRFPGKVLADPAGQRLFIADSNHNRLVIATLQGKLLDVIGSGEIGSADGEYAKASFNKPQGMALKDQTLYVADTENHLLRKIDLASKQVTTIAGRGFQGRNPWPGLDMAAAREAGGDFKLPDRWVAPPLKTAINSPWALWVHGEDLYIAMAGPHQIWKMPLDESEIGPYAGNGREDIVDGPLLPKRPYEEGYSSFAQPSGLTSDGTWLYVADSEGSSIRAVPFDPDEEVKTVVGSAHLPVGRLFAFGDVDGEGEVVRLQHVLGVTYGGGQLYVADTYNHKIKQIDPQKQSARTIAGNGKRGRGDEPAQFYEPAGLCYAAGKLYVADTNNHLIRVIDLEQGNKVTTLAIEGLQPPDPPEPKPAAALPGAKQVDLPAATVKPVDGQVRLAVKLALPEGWKINPLAPMTYRIEASSAGPIQPKEPGKPQKVAEPATNFEIALPVTAATGEETVQVSLTYYYCQEGAEGLCKVGSVTWNVPLKLSPDAQQASVPLEWTVK